MIAADSIVGLSEIDSLPDTIDTSEIDEYNSDLRAELAVNASSDHIPVTRANGVTHTLTIPRGGTITGASALLRMDGWTWEEMTGLSRAAMHLAFPGGGGFSFFGPPPSDEEIANQRKEALARLDAFLDGARAYARARDAAAAGGPRHDVDVKLEGMLPVLAGHMPLFVHPNGAREIRAALEWAAGHDLRIVILDRGDTWRAAEELAAANVPVVIAAVTVVPRLPDDPYDAMYANAARLAEAGVKVVIADSGDDANTEDRNIPFQAGMAAAFGLPRQEALRAVTLYPAQILGLDDALGSIEVGKSASLVLTDGDLLEIRSNVMQEWIDGRPVDLESRHTRLWKKWRDRPRPTGR
jgi:imidazolonepropionase-like amidohydrolase